MDVNISIEELKARKRELGHTNESLARMSGVPLSTVQKIMGGSTKNPRKETLRELALVLFPGRFIDPRLLNMDRDPEAAGLNKTMEVHDSGNPALKDDDIPFTGSRQGSYTVEDFRRLPDDTRMELIDGKLYYLAAPTTVHQIIVTMIVSDLMNYSVANGSHCLPLASPVDVQLDCDDKTMLQPDVVVICDDSKVMEKNIYGAPDLAVEVLSPSTRGVDMILKFNKYWVAGVKEYWIVDPEDERISVYEFDKLTPPHFYSFEDKIPVGISGGDLVIDFSRISAAIRKYTVPEAAR